MTDQTITVEIEHRPGLFCPWKVTTILGESYFTDDEFAATGLTPPELPITITIGEQTVELTREEAERLIEEWPFPFTATEGPEDRAVCKFAAALRAHLEAEQHG